MKRELENATVHTDRVADDVAITESVVDRPDGDTAPYAVRVVWSLKMYPEGETFVVRAVPDDVKQMYNGCSNKRPGYDGVPESHIDDLETEVRLMLADERYTVDFAVVLPDRLEGKRCWNKMQSRLEGWS
jgi:hypothetical protein